MSELFGTSEIADVLRVQGLEQEFDWLVAIIDNVEGRRYTQVIDEEPPAGWTVQLVIMKSWALVLIYPPPTILALLPSKGSEEKQGVNRVEGMEIPREAIVYKISR